MAGTKDSNQLDEMEVFLKALDIAEPREREIFLDRICRGDAAFRSSIELLLRHHFKKGGVLESPAIDPKGTGIQD